MNRLNSMKREQVVATLVDGVGINASTRMTDVSKPTVLKLLADLGAACDSEVIRGERQQNIVNRPPPI